MVYKSSYYQIIIRVVLLCLTCIIMSWFVMEQKEWIPAFFIFITLMIQVISLIRYLNMTNRKLALFFGSIKNDDGSLSYKTEGYPKSFQQLFSGMDEVRNYIQEKNVKSETNNQFYRIINDHIATGVVCFDEYERIHIINKAACKILSVNSIHYISHIKTRFPDLYDIFTSIQPGDQKICKLWVEHKMRILSIQTTHVNIPQGKVKIISFQDIKNEMDEKELEAWQKLIRVIAHEIMNSIAPITSLSETLLNYYLKDKIPVQINELTSKNIENTIEGLQAIAERGEELSKFVHLYRKLTRIPHPTIQDISLEELFMRLKTLVQKELTEKNTRLRIANIPDGMMIKADSGLIMQVLLNMVRNAAEAMVENVPGEIQISATRTEQMVSITIEDNGKGIDQQTMENIFLPFFTTKENGSGIGLSFSQQVMRLHGGKILVESQPTIGTKVILQF